MIAVADAGAGMDSATLDLALEPFSTTGESGRRQTWAEPGLWLRPADRPDLKAPFATGYTRNAIVHHGRLDPGIDFIARPYSFAALSEKVRPILDRTDGP